MKKLRNFISYLFILAVFLGSLHEILHKNIHDQSDFLEHSCPVYVLASVVAVPNESTSIVYIPKVFEEYDLKPVQISYGFIYFPSSRAPPSA